MKQETLEEFIQRQLSLGKYQDQESAIRHSILAGAKWQQQQIQSLRDELYDELPIGEVNSFELIKLINNYIKKLDELILKNTL